jgi:Carboxypeptidase regulatory-like domain
MVFFVRLSSIGTEWGMIGNMRGLRIESFAEARAMVPRGLGLLAALIIAGVSLGFASSALAVESHIAGKVTSAATEAPIEEVEVCAYSNVTSGCTKTSSSGEYDLLVYYGGDFTVEFYGPEGSSYIHRTFYDNKYSYTEAVPVSVPEGGTASGIDAELHAGGTISGTATGAMSKAGLEAIEVCAREPEHPRNLNLPAKNSGCAKTNSMGEYTIQRLATGSYEVEFALALPSDLNYFNQFYDGKSSWPEADLVSVLAGSATTGVDGALDEGGQIAGVVTSSATQEPITGATACAGGTTEDGYESRCAKTDAQGEYTIPRLRGGKFWVEFSDKGYVTGAVGSVFGLSEPEEPVSVVVGSTTKGIDLALEELPRIDGLVTNILTKAPIEGAEVCVRLVSSTANGPCASTDAQGEYSISGLEVGEYTVEFSAAGLNYLPQYFNGAIFSYDATRISATPGADLTGIDAELEAPGEISGEVTAAGSGAPLEGIYVCAGEPPAGNRTCDTTDAQGEYTITGLPGREYYVEFNAGDVNYLSQFYKGKSSRAEAQLVPVLAGGEVAGVDAELAKIKGGGLTGTVSSSETSRPIAGIEVCAYPVEGEGFFGECAKTEARGEYTITGLTAGSRYVVAFSSPFNSGLNYVAQFYDGKSSASEADTVGITAGSLDPGIDAQLREGGRIGGKVVDASSGTPIAGVEVCAFGVQSESVGCATSNTDGEYLIAGLAHGGYMVEFSSPMESGLDYVTQYFDDRPSPSDAETVSVEEGGTTSQVDAALIEGGRIAGEVTSSTTSAAMPDVLVCALVSNHDAVGCAITDASGDYTISGLASGIYKVGFEAGEGYAAQYYDDRATFSSAQALTVALGTTLGDVDASMSAGPPVAMPTPPVDTTLPAVSGTPAVGHGLFCADGLWTGRPVPAFTFQWLRDGAPIAGAMGSSYQVADVDAGASLACQVTARNDAGEQGATSLAVEIPASIATATATPGTASAVPAEGNPRHSPGLVRIEGSGILITGDTVAVELKCTEAQCRGSIELVEATLAERRKGAMPTSHRKTVVLAKGSFSLTKGKSAAVRLRLTAMGRSRLAHARHHPIAASLVLSVEGVTTTKSVLAS